MVKQILFTQEVDPIINLNKKTQKLLFNSILIWSPKMIHLIHLVTFWTDSNQNTKKNAFLFTQDMTSHIWPPSSLREKTQKSFLNSLLIWIGPKLH